MTEKDPSGTPGIEERLHRILEGAADAMVIVDQRGFIVLANVHAEKLFDYSRKEIIGQPINVLVPVRRIAAPQIEENFFAHFKSRILGTDGALYANRRDGSEFPVELKLNPIEADDGTMLLISIADITERRRAETLERDNLHKAQELYAAVITGSHDAIITKTLDGMVTSWNGGAERLFGYTVKEMIGKPIVTLIPPAQFVEETEILARIGRGEHITQYDTRRQRKNGSLIEVSISVSPLHDSQGRIVGASEIARDISVQKVVARLVEHRDEILRTIASSVLDAVLMMDGGGKIVFWNRAATDMFGYSSREAVGKELHRLLAPSRFHAAFESAHNKFRETGRGNIIGKTQEMMALTKDGSEIPIDLLVTAVEIRGEWHAIGVMRNVTERSRIRAELDIALQEQQVMAKLKDELVAVAAHELRTPMSAIKGLISMVLDQDLGPVNEALKVPLQDVLDSTDSLIRLVNDLLDAYRLESNELHVRIGEVDVLDLVGKVVRQLRPLTRAKNLELAMDVQRDSLMVRADPTKLVEVLRNLIGNAVKFTDRGKVTVEVSEVEPNVVVRIRDTGIGIKPDDQLHLFEKFYQASNQGKGKPSGTGLGLYICKWIIEKMGGALWLEQSAPGEGSVFMFTLPSASPANQQTATPEIATAL